MALKKKKNKEKETTIENYYDLKTDKVDELVAALKDGTAPEDEELSFDIEECTGVNEQADDGETKKRKKKNKQFDPYAVDKLARVPAWLKAVFIKFWFAGCVCYFIMMGIGLRDIDAVVLMGVVLGLIVDIMVNPIFRFMESDRKEYNAFMMFPFPFKQIWTFLTNILYYIVVLFCVNYCYLGLEQLINLIAGTQNKYYVGVEPLLFGVFATIVDMAFLGIKDLIVYLVKKRRTPAFDFEGEVGLTEGVSSADGGANVADEVVGEEADGDMDEIERLRRLAENSAEEKAKNGKNKNKK